MTSVPSNPSLMSWIIRCKNIFSLQRLHALSSSRHFFGSASCFLKCTHPSGQAFLDYTITQTKTQTKPPRPNTCTHSQHDRIAGVCLVREEEWAEIRSCDPPVCLRLYHSNLTAVTLFKQRQMASGKVRKSLRLLSFLYPSIYCIYVLISLSLPLLFLQALSAD